MDRQEKKSASESIDEKTVAVNETSETSSDLQSMKRVRWEIGLAILAVGVLLGFLVWNLMSYDRTFQVMYSLPIVSGTPFFFAIWWLFFSGISHRTRKRGIILSVVTMAVLCGVYRIDGFSGEMLPIIKYRWEPSSQQKAKEYWASIDSSKPAKPKQDEADAVELKNSKGGNSTNAAVITHGPSIAIQEGDWPGFRGPRRDGVYRGEPIRTNWDDHPPQELWRHPVGLGWSSFAVVDGFAYTQEQRGTEECVVCYEFETGDQIWIHETTTLFSEPMGGDGPRATPTFFDGKLYSLGANGDLFCLKAIDGKEVWATNILEDVKTQNLPWAMAGSPLVIDDLVIVNPGSPPGETSGRALIAYDRISGDEVWAAGDYEASYCAPRLESILGVEQVLLFDGQGIAGHDPTSGKERWRFGPWTNGPKVNAAQPIMIGESSLFIGTGYGTGATLLDLTKKEKKWTVKQRWPEGGSRAVMRLKFGSAVYKEGFIYGIDEKILACIDAETGQQKWRKGRYGYGQVLLMGETILVQAEQGHVAIVEANPEKFREITSFPALNAQTWNHPVVVNGRLLVRNAEEAACFDVFPAKND